VQSPELRRSGVSQTSSGARGGIMYAQRCVVVGIMLTTLGGCVALEDGPDRVFPVTEQVTVIRDYEGKATWPTDTTLWTTSTRNDFVTERMYAMDLEYNQYFSRLTNQMALGNSSVDIVSTALAAAGTAFASTVTKTALSAVNTVVIGTRTAVDKDILISSTIQILQSTMENSRALVRDRISGNLTCSMPKYTVWQALADLEDYYRAGTLPGALEALQAVTGSNSQKGKDSNNGQTQQHTPVVRSQGVTANGARVMALAAPPAGGSPAPQCSH
jgi:hypothetical protein